ncbi:MAG: hypothetical protein KME04_01520 [Pleurocapsa minor GSE-CHR-MK-17-07R]|jgi:hypothetical protein|nr:hypothetical protein [Pleurocapsa minor GSE-CHR-MK 17-07R]
MTRNTRSGLLLIFGLIALIGASMLPVVVNPGAGLTFVLLDTAEWSSLHPAVQTENPALLTSGLLRLAFACAGLVTAFGLSARFNRASALIALAVLFAAQLPPFEFLGERGNTNYQQQLLIALGFLGIGTACVLWPRARWSWLPGLAAGTIGLAGLLAGLARVISLMTELALPVSAGPGAWLLGLALAGVIILLAVVAIQTKTGPQQKLRPVSIGVKQ